MKPQQREGKPVTSRNGNGNGANLIPWAALVISIAGGVFVFVWSQINPKGDFGALEARLTDQMRSLETRMREADADLHKEIAENKRDVEMRLPIAEHNEFKLRKDKDTERQELMLNALATGKISKDQYTEGLAQVIARIDGQRDAINKIQETFTGSYNIGKALDALQANQAKQQELFQSRIGDLERRLDMRPVAPQTVLPVAPLAPNSR